MLRVERLICKDNKHHHHCQWIENATTYPDTQLSSLKTRLQKAVGRTGIASRILHDEKGVLITIKRGHDKQLYIVEAEE